MVVREEIVPKSYPTNLLKKDWSQRKCYYRQGWKEVMEKIHDLEVKDDDVWLVTLPKCGTTWMQELVWLVMHDYDFEAAKSEHLDVRSPYMEFNFVINRDLETALKPVEDLKSPRLIKSHLPLPLLPAQLWQKKPKVIFVYRNPKDSMVSEYYHMRSVGQEMNVTLEEYITHQKECSTLTPLPFEFVAEFYALRHEPWLYYTTFERMKRDLRRVIEDICTFLNKTINEEQMQQMLHHLSFEQMRDNPKTNNIWSFEKLRSLHMGPYESHNFVRRGKVGGYKDELSLKCIEEMDHWIKKNLSLYNLTLDELLLTDDH